MKIPWLSIAFTLIILYVAATQLDWGSLVSSIQSADLQLLGFAFVGWFILIIFKALKWQKIVSCVNGKVGFIESIRILFIGLFVSVITPGRAGDFVRAIYLKDRLDMGKGILAVLIDRIIDVTTLLIFAGVGIALLTQSGDASFINVQTVSLFFILFVIAIALVLNRRMAKSLGLPLINRFAPIRFRGIIQKYGRQFYDALPLLRKRWSLLVIGIVYSTIAWFLSITFGWYIMLALGIDLPWTAAVAVVPVLALVEIIPIGVMGIGTREVAAALILGIFGIPKELAVAYSLTYFAMGYIPSFILGAFFFNRYPVPIEGGLKGIFTKWNQK